MDIYQHFRKEEHQFIDQALSWKEEVERTYQNKLTDFLDPREQQIVDMLIGTNHDDLQLKMSGGGRYSERKRAIIAPFYEDITESDYQLSLLKGTYPDKFVRLSHRDVMGAFLSLGIDRKTLGDIYVEDGRIQLITTCQISPYIRTNLTMIKNAKVILKDNPLQELEEVEKKWVETSQTVSSLRLDNVVKEIYNISRKNAVEHVKSKHVKVNFKMIDDPTFQLQENDMISLRGKGRSKLTEIGGQTRKNRIRMTTAILK